MLNLICDLVIQAQSAFMKAENINMLELARVQFLGKNGYINQQLKKLNTVKAIEKSKLGYNINSSKRKIQKLFIERKKILELKIIENSLNVETIDITLPGKFSKIGTLHPITATIHNIKKFFNYLGFIEINGPEIENDYFNFDALNIPKDHPSRDAHDTFWIDSEHLLRTHTSGMQIRTLINAKLPTRIISVGRVYRKDCDKNHSPMFHQIEGVLVDHNINFSNLKKILYDFLYFFFEKKTILRFRPSYFPFTEPSAEIDIMVAKKQCNKNWTELLGCGMIHPNVLRNVGIDSKKFSGFAFGIGIERLVMLLHHITDIRVFFENDLEFLNQF